MDQQINYINFIEVQHRQMLWIGIKNHCGCYMVVVAKWIQTTKRMFDVTCTWNIYLEAVNVAQNCSGFPFIYSWLFEELGFVTWNFRDKEQYLTHCVAWKVWRGYSCERKFERSNLEVAMSKEWMEVRMEMCMFGSMTISSTMRHRPSVLQLGMRLIPEVCTL